MGIVCLSVDGEKLVEASAEDIDCPQDNWQCKFRFVGERCTDYEVYETNTDGAALNIKSIVSQKAKFSRECSITLMDYANLATAELIVDNVDFHNLPLKREQHSEANLSLSAQALQLTYGIPVPYKVNQQ